MKNKRKIDWDTVLAIIIYGIIILFALSIIALNIYGLIKYGGKPMNEVPWWVWWLRLGGRR